MSRVQRREDKESCPDATLSNRLSQAHIPMAALPDTPSRTLRMVPSADGLDRGQFRSVRREIGDCVLSHTEMDALAMCRRDVQHAQNIGHLVLISRYFHGSSKGYLEYGTIDRMPGSIYLLNGALQWEGIREAGLLQSVYVPKSLIGFDAEKHPGFLILDPAMATGDCMNTCMNEMFDQQLSRSEQDIVAGLESLIAWVKIAFEADHNRGDVRTHAREAMFRKICAYIECNLHTSDLCMPAILQNFGVSRASLYRMFEPHGGVRNYITDRRALRAVFDLAHATGQRGEVRSIGEKWGFPSPVEFNRTVRRLYDRSPGTLFRPRDKKISSIAA